MSVKMKRTPSSPGMARKILAKYFGYAERDQWGTLESVVMGKSPNSAREAVVWITVKKPDGHLVSLWTDNTVEMACLILANTEVCD